MGYKSKMGYNSKKYKEYKKETNNRISKKKWISSIKKLISKANYSKALSEVDKYLDQYPNDSFGLYQYSIILKDLGKKEEAKDILRKIIDEGMESQYAALYKLGLIEALDGNQELAEEYFKRNIDTSPYEEIYSYIELSRIKTSRGIYKEALEILDQIKNASDPRVIIELARVYKISGDSEKAYETIKKYDFNGENTTNDSEAYITKANIEISLGLHEEAIKDFNKALENYKGNGYYKALVELGSAYFDINKYNQAYEICKEAIDKNNSKIIGKAHLILGRIYMEMDEYDLAKEHFEKSVNYKYFVDDIGYFYIATMEMNKENYEEAQKYLDMVNPKNVYNKNSIVLLRSAFIAYKQKDYKKSREILDQIDANYIKEDDLNDYQMLRNYLDLREGKDIDANSYSIKQIKSYSIKRLLNHINKAHIGMTDESYFNKDINLFKLILEVPDLLEKATVKDNQFCITYQVKYPNIGISNKEVTDILNIVMLPEDDKILTMYPSYPKIEKKISTQTSNQKVKQKSQVDKFYAKYGKK